MAIHTSLLLGLFGGLLPLLAQSQSACETSGDDVKFVGSDIDFKSCAGSGLGVKNGRQCCIDTDFSVYNDASGTCEGRGLKTQGKTFDKGFVVRSIKHYYILHFVNAGTLTSGCHARAYAPFK